jgi:hypothetical protein
MAPRKKAARRRRPRFKGLNVPQAIIGYAGASIWSEALLGVTPIQFFMSPSGTHTNEITLKELLDSFMGGAGGVASNWQGTETNALQIIQSNASRGWIDATIKSVGLGAGSTVVLKLTKKPRAFLNRTVRNFGLGDVLKF